MPLIADQYLWGMDHEGYREVEGIGYGYFWNFDTLSQAIDRGDFDKNDVIALYYKSHDKVLIDKTSELKW